MTFVSNPAALRTFRKLRTTVAGLALGWCGTFLAAACDEEAGGCTEGETQACVCPSGMGAQTCQADSSWGSCSCGGNGDGGGTGNADDGNGNGDGDGDGDGDDGMTASCCLNGSFFECPDGDAAEACFTDMDPGTCQSNSSRDAECSGADSGGPGDGGDGMLCGDPGDTCNTHGDCCDDDVLCADAVCSAACSFDSDCQSGCCADLVGGGAVCSPIEFCV